MKVECVMGLLNWIFGSKKTAVDDDRVWLSHIAKDHGLCVELKQRLRDHTTILVVAHFQETLTRIDRELARQHIPRAITHNPILPNHLVAQYDRGHKRCVVLALRRQLQLDDHKPGDEPKTTRIERLIQGEHSEAKTPQGATGARMPIVVIERHFLATRDEEIRKFAEALHRPYDLEYHLSLEDALMKKYGGEWVKSLLDRTGMDEATALHSPMISKRIRAAQAQVAQLVKDDYRETDTPEEWLRVHLGEASSARVAKVR
jgi:hypothetical protein